MRQRKLEDLCKEEDVESSTRKLVDQVAKLNDRRFQAMKELKVNRAFMLITYIVFSCLKISSYFVPHSF
jgi:hypothetical protein